MSKELRNNEVKFLQEYLDWKNDRVLIPPTWSPTEYAEFLRLERNDAVIDKALEMLEKYNKGTDWNKEMLDSLEGMLRSNK